MILSCAVELEPGKRRQKLSWQGRGLQQGASAERQKSRPLIRRRIGLPAPGRLPRGMQTLRVQCMPHQRLLQKHSLLVGRLSCPVVRLSLQKVEDSLPGQALGAAYM